MGLFGSIAGGALGAAGSIFGGISASKAMKQVKRNLQSQQRKNQDWYDRRYNEDATQRADAQAMLTRVEKGVKDRNRQAAGVQAVMGGTDESVAAAKATNNEAIAQSAAGIVTNGEARKDQIERQYQTRDAQIDEALNNLEVQKAHAIGSAMQGVAQAAGGLAGAF